MAEKNTTYRIFEHISDVDISEQDIMDYDPVVLDKLLIDHTMSARARAEASDQEKVVNIFWATSDYENSVLDEHGNFIEEGYRYDDEIKPEHITGRFRRIVMPRVLKDKQAKLSLTAPKTRQRCLLHHGYVMHKTISSMKTGLAAKTSSIVK